MPAADRRRPEQTAGRAGLQSERDGTTNASEVHSRHGVCRWRPLAQWARQLARYRSRPLWSVSIVITTVMLLLLWFGVAQVDLPVWVSRLFVSDPVKVQAVGLGIHLTMGLGFAWVFALVEPHLRFSPSQNGLIFGVVLWALVQTIGVPTLSAGGRRKCSGNNLWASPVLCCRRCITEPLRKSSCLTWTRRSTMRAG
jgi:hypothetical protein